ncbi:MAG: 50S ribosomal protein L9 [Desulfovibrionaceae bacterium CG1_02_65_16]|nr:MAG: 50S ribosomal protein L9 [Desulfovibrionaceae bacterium CG1_02_65_16]
MTMKLILRADVDALGRLGDIVAVKPGFGRNYLIPQGLAMVATEANLKQFELERKKLAVQADGLRAEATSLAEKIAAAIVVIPVRVGEGDKLYGSVTAQNVADALAEQGIDIDRRKIEMPDAIRALGDFEVDIRLHPDVHGELKLRVIKHGQPEQQPEPQPEA